MDQNQAKIHCFVFFYLSFVQLAIVHCESEERVLEWIEPLSCRNQEYDFFHTNLLKCEKCSINLVASKDGYGCVCDEKSRTVGIKDGLPVCVACGAGKIRTSDQLECISCRERGKFCGCLGNYKTVERNWNGTILDEQRCLPCPKNTYVSRDRTQCLPCSEIWSGDDRDDFSLDNPSWDNLRRHCMPIDSPKDWPDLQSTYTIKFNNKRIHIDSFYFRKELRFAFHSCEIGVQRACSQLANMCSLTLFAKSSPSCKPFLQKNEIKYMPKIFYPEGEATIVLNRRKISQRYSLDQADPISNKLKLVVAKFGLRGKFEIINEPDLPCQFFGNLSFGVNLYKKCRIPAAELFHTKMTFLVPFLAYYEKTNANTKILHPVPILIKNINENLEKDLTRWQLVKRFFSVDKITGYRALSNSKNSSYSKGSQLHVLRYIKSLHLVVKLQERGERGKIFPPLLIVEYDELANEEIVENVEVSVEYKVSFSFSEDETSVAIEVCIGIFTGLAVAFSTIQAWSDSRRSGRNLASFSTAVSFIIYSLGAIGNVLLIICSSSCIYTFVFYKGQKVVHSLLPNTANEWTVKICTIVAFAFKTIEMMSLIYHQRRANIFFIDWEPEPPRLSYETFPSTNKWDSPRLSLGKHYNDAGELSSSNERRKKRQSASEIIGARRKKTTSPSRSSASISSSRESIVNEIPNENRKAGQPAVATVCSGIDFSIDELNVEDRNFISIWRTCVVANEWLRIKTKRKISIFLQILATAFFLEILGGKYLSKAIPDFVFKPDQTLFVAESFTLRYAVGILVYLVVYTSQWWFSVFIYQRYVKNQLQEFVDLCSIANISVFVLSHDYYGYYIHGRSVHGFADTDFLTLVNNLKREELDLCAHRGLIPGTTEQTFVISLSRTFRTFYERLVGSQNSRDERFLRSNIPNFPADWEERWKIHLKLKKFLNRFVDHCYKNVDYTIKERHFFEKMFDFEMADVYEKSIFYQDNAYSFDRTMFYGNEWSLATFEMNVFLLVLVFQGDFVLALCTVLLVSKIMNAVVLFHGKKLLAETTFIDDRLLVD